MTTKRMLIDASHPEETRVAIVSGQHLDDFDVEVESRRQLRGNIYLAKVTRVEPSLQAAFVDYGGNRHGFLAFSEIHPDYYQIPVADREALVAEQQEAETEAGAEADAKAEAEAKKGGGDAAEGEGSDVEVLGGDEAEEVQAERPVAIKRHYKIQEVIKRRQILLVQVVKEERGTKGAALTTYLSLAGRYCVLMPNTARGGGISRKIANAPDRKRLKNILSDLKIPGVMAVIVRTAGSKRSKAEIKRDYEYLMRLWESVREVTLESMAPCLVHEEGDLIKRSIRDLYDKDIDEIIIDGDEAYRTAKDFMKLLIPSHTKRVQPFKETGKQLFQHFHVEPQLHAMHSPDVQLKSGGYIVINPTEALVSIDVNSGRSTRGRNIEETALKTNIEASDEIARQLKLRDLAGLIVIDYIDMEENRNQTKVERRLKDAMRSDRARIQIGRISPFGLLELSRQRMRPSLIETSSDPCPYCEGTGIRRSADSAALHLLRAIKEEAMQQRAQQITVHIPTTVALYILNNQRDVLAEIEATYKMSIIVETDDTLIPPAYRMERDGKTVEEASAGMSKGGDDEDSAKRRRRRGRRRRGAEDSSETTHETATQAAPETTPQAATESGDVPDGEDVGAAFEGDDDKPVERKRRRRGRRGGRRRGRKPAEQMAQETAGDLTEASTDAVSGGEAPEAPPETAEETAGEAPAETTPKTATEAGDVAEAEAAPEGTDKMPEKKDEKEKKPAKRTRTRRTKKTETEAESAAAEPAPADTKDDTKAEAADKKSAKEKPARAPRRKAKPAAAEAPEAPEAATPVAVSPAPASPDVSKPAQTEPETPEPVAAAKTETITVGSEKEKDDAEKKTKKGWWS
ncbi:MAG: Rne/Rng family ribonuclease [Alphaproteobacteria bacterium]|nr:Rne/Rng family ribonuclease [Alphaproteobacteria bacterium]